MVKERKGGRKEGDAVLTQSGKRDEGREEGGRRITYPRVVKEKKGGRKEGDAVLIPTFIVGLPV